MTYLVPQPCRGPIGILALVLVVTLLPLGADSALHASSHREEPLVDLNDDGQDDLIVPIPYKKIGAGRIGAILALLRQAKGGFDEQASLFFPAPPKTLGFGSSFAAIHDSCQEGLLVVGAPRSTVATKKAAGSTWMQKGDSHSLWEPIDDGTAFPASARAGMSLEAADYDGDGCKDLAVGAPGWSGNTGGVRLYSRQQDFRRSGGLSPAKISFAQIHSFEANLHAREFGSTLASGRLTKDQRADLLVGAPATTVNGKANAGEVYQHNGAAPKKNKSAAATELLVTKAAATFRRGAGGIAGTPTAGDRFGDSLAVGNFDGKGLDNLVIGSRYLTWNGVKAAGGFYMRRDNKTWFSAGLATPNAHFAAALAVGDVNGDGIDDLVIGAPGLPSGAIANNGAIYAYLGGPTGLTFWRSFSIPPHLVAQAKGLGFGESLQLGDFFGLGRDLVAVAAPCFDLTGKPNAGAIIIVDLVAGGFYTPLHLDSGDMPGTAAANDYLGGASTAVPKLCGKT